MSVYNFKDVEAKWQHKWEETNQYKTDTRDTSKPLYYTLEMFPYPSGKIHMGHVRNYSIGDVVARFKKMEGYNVLHPMGWDSFGLPAENYAIKTKTHPRTVTDRNIAHFTEQLKRIGFSFDWERVIDTTEEDYYKWTQWIFLKMFEHGLVFRDKTLVNYCPSCKVVLSNEDSQGGKCDICHSDVVQKSKDVWYLRITEYADKLLDGLKTVDYPANIRMQQENWIGRSVGAFVNFPLDGIDEKLRIYTTRPDTLFGVTFMVIAPEHPIIDKYADRISNMDEIVSYRNVCAKKTEFERTQLVKDKTGVCIKGFEAVNPISGKKIPVYISDYVMMGYGTGAIMAVPAHDDRDYDFAKKFGIEIIEVIKGGNIEDGAYSGDGEMINSGFLDGSTNKKESIEKMIHYISEKGIGEAGVQYKMKDWAFNRQRYWGEPIPIVHCEKCGMVAVPYDELPLRLPDMENFEPGEGGESPLAKIDSFVNCKCPKCGGAAKRETDTMPQWAGSSWYFLRYIDPHNTECFADSDALKYWLPVDWYNGGMEHVTRHLIYSRFWHRFLYDIGEVPTAEPYAKRSAQGMILGENGAKMSKSLGNVVDPDDVVNKYGADTLRTYVLFMGDYGSSAPWSETSVKGCKRFLDRTAALIDLVSGEDVTPELEASFHKTIKKVTDDIDLMKFNTAIATLMSLLNEIYEAGKLTKKELSVFIRLLCPFAPHLCEEMWEQLGEKGFISLSEWPKYDEGKTIAKTVDKSIEIPIQINGKLRSVITVDAESPKESILETARADERVSSAIDGKTVVKEIYVPGKLVNIVVK